jgi:hypothetical protein
MQNHFISQQLPRVTQQVPNPLALCDDFRVEPGDVPERIPVSLGRAGFACTAVHAAAPFALHHGRAARSAGAGLGAAKRPREHRKLHLEMPTGRFWPEAVVVDVGFR